MSKNLISVSALCTDNPINVLFFDSFFQVQDHHTGVTLVCGQHRDGVYYWPKSVPLQSSTLVLSSLAQSSLATISMGHSHLIHLSLPKFQNFLSVLSVKPGKKSIFLKNGKTVISVGNGKFIVLDDETDFTVEFISQNLVTPLNFVGF